MHQLRTYPLLAILVFLSPAARAVSQIGPERPFPAHATPDAPGREREALWTELLEAGVDLINTDDLDGLRTFFRKHPKP